MRLKSFFQINRWYIISAFVMTLVYFFTRLTNLVDLPIFTDEAIYIRWAQIGSNDASWRFISLTDGKQPLYVWAVMVTIRLFSDPLFAGRIVSVATGFFSLIGIAFLTYEFFKSKKAAFIASLLYLTSPFTLMYDRLALMDSMLAMFSIWSLYLAILTVRSRRLDTALLLGMSLGGAVLTKTSGFLSIYLLPVTLLLLDFKDKKWRVNVIKVLGLFIIAVLISQVMYSVLRLSPWFHMVAAKDKEFVYSFNEWLEHPLQFFIGNMKALIEWTWNYLTIPIDLLILASIILIKFDTRKKLLLLIWSFAPMIALALFAERLYPRFILFMAMPLLILASWSVAYGFDRLKVKGVTKFAMLALIIAYPVFVQGKILYSVLTAPIPHADVTQYISDIFSGWGIREVNDKIGELARDQEITVFTDGTFGLLPYGVEIYHVNNPNIHIIGIYPSPEEYTDQMIQELQTRPTYYVANQLDILPERWNTVLIGKWQKGERKDRSLRLYRLYEPGVTPPEDEGIPE